MRWWVVLLVATGCRQLFGISDPLLNDGGSKDARIDAPSAQGCYGSVNLTVCPVVVPTGDLQLQGTIVTDTSPMCAELTGANAGSLCVVAGASIRVGASSILTATGGKPLVLLATSSISIDGTLDVASRANQLGAGANPSSCDSGTNPTTGASGGGGYGGSFGGKGGDGASNDGGIGGVSAPIATGTSFRGGCAGSAGAPANTAGTKGDGGGAVYLIASTTIKVAGIIDASGAGGGGAKATDSGGGGGGAGGMIGFDADMIAIGGLAFADGGGGGEGAGGTQFGNSGADPTGAASAPGGSGGALDGGDGGAGAHGATLNGANGTPGSTNGGGSGGGGGGAGVIVIHGAASVNGTVSPTGLPV